MNSYVVFHHGFSVLFISAPNDEQMLKLLAAQKPGILPHNFSVCSPKETGIIAWEYFQEDTGAENLDQLPQTPLTEWGNARGLKYPYQAAA